MRRPRPSLAGSEIGSLRKPAKSKQAAPRCRRPRYARRVYLRQEVDGCCVDLGGVL